MDIILSIIGVEGSAGFQGHTRHPWSDGGQWVQNGVYAGSLQATIGAYNDHFGSHFQELLETLID